MKHVLPAVLLATAALAVPAGADETARALRRAKSVQSHSSDRNAAQDRQSTTSASQIEEAESGLKAAQLRAIAAKAAEQAQADRMSQARAPLVGMVAALARMARRPPALALASGASVSDVARLGVLTRYMREWMAAQNAAFAEERDRYAAARGETAAAMTALDGSRRLLDQRRLALSGSGVDLVAGATTLPQAGDEARASDRQSAALQVTTGSSRRDRALSERLASLPGPVLRPDSPAARFVGASRPLYRLPGIGRVVAGTGEHDADGVRARGLTLATAPGLAVLAPAAGRVSYAGPFRNYGDIVIIDHGHGWTSLVAGLARTPTELGADLFQGATVGHSARRLLIELRHDGRPVDIVAMADALQP